MEVTALLRSLLLLLLVTFSCSQTDDFPQIDPDRQQYFEGETLTVSCEGLNGLTRWRVMKRVKGNTGPCTANWETSTGSCTVEGVSAEYDSGQYWCEMGGQQRSNTVNITVTGGSVILESPVHPVMQGDNVTLSCRTKQTSSNFIAEFYKDGFSIGKTSTGIISSLNLSRFGDGFYRCNISGVGESPESWLSVVSEEASPHHNPLWLFLLLSFGGSVLLVLLMFGFLLCQTYRPAARGQTESAALTQESSSAEPMQTTYATVTKPRDVKESGAGEQTNTTYVTVTRPTGVQESNAAEQTNTTYATVTRPREVKESSSAEPIHTTYATVAKESSSAEPIHTTYATVAKEPEAPSYSASWIDMRHFYHTID